MIVLADSLAPFTPPPIRAEKVTIWGKCSRNMWVTDLDKDTVNSHA